MVHYGPSASHLQVSIFFKSFITLYLRGKSVSNEYIESTLLYTTDISPAFMYKTGTYQLLKPKLKQFCYKMTPHPISNLSTLASVCF